MKKPVILNNKYIRRLTYLTGGFLIYCLIAVISMVVFTNKSLLDYPLLVQNPTNSAYFIQLQISLQHQDLDSKSASYLVNFKPFGNNSTQGPLAWDRDITFNFFPSMLTVKKGQIIKPYKFEVDLIDGNSKDFPFDVYSTDLGFLAIDNSTNQPIPLGMNANVRTISTTTTFMQQSSQTQSSGEQLYYFEVTVYRSKIVFVFCFFISSLTWILTILMMVMAYDTLINHRELHPPIVSLGVVILFALPALRNTQPGVPGIGCAIDYLCFFWCETLVALSSCIIIGCYTLRYSAADNC